MEEDDCGDEGSTGITAAIAGILLGLFMDEVIRGWINKKLKNPVWWIVEVGLDPFIRLEPR